MLELTLRTNELDDGSKTHDVVLSDPDNGDNRFVFPAISERDAMALIYAFEDAIKNHTNEEVKL